MLEKSKVHHYFVDLITTKITTINNLLSELSLGASSDTKSSAGDKYETATAMIHIEQENLRKQLHDLVVQKAILLKINEQVVSPQIIKGSLVKTSNGFFYLSVALGKVIIDSIPVIAVSTDSPLGLKMLGLFENERIEINSTVYTIEKIY